MDGMVVVGVDAHKRVHVAAALDAQPLPAAKLLIAVDDQLRAAREALPPHIDRQPPLPIVQADT